MIPLLILNTLQAFADPQYCYWYGECYNMGYGKGLQSSKWMLLSQLDQNLAGGCTSMYGTAGDSYGEAIC